MSDREDGTMAVHSAWQAVAIVLMLVATSGCGDRPPPDAAPVAADPARRPDPQPGEPKGARPPAGTAVPEGVASAATAPGTAERPLAEEEPAPAPAVDKLGELNSPLMWDLAPWVSPDGLRLYWSRRQGEGVWTAERERPDAPFGSPRRLVGGIDPTLTADELELVVVKVGGDGKPKLCSATRPTRAADFPEPASFADAPAERFWNVFPCLSADGLTLIHRTETGPGAPRFVVRERKDRKSPWGAPEPLSVTLPASVGPDLVWPALTPDGLTLFCGHRMGAGQEQSEILRATRSGLDEPFTGFAAVEVGGKPLVGISPFHVPATGELFFAETRQTTDGRDFDLRFVKGLQPARAAAPVTMTAAPPAEGISDPAAPSEFRFSDGFSSEQGRSGWHYQEWDGTRYADMTWDAAGGRWKGSHQWSLISKGSAHPDRTDAVIVWQAPRAGDVTIDGVVERQHLGGDGTRVRILRNETPVWPPDDWQPVYPSFMARHVVVTRVEAGDRIRFHVNGGGPNISHDETLWDPVVRYDSPPPFVLGASRYVMTEPDLKRVGIHTMDASLSVLPGPDDQFYWLHSEIHGTRHQKFLGTLDEPARKPVFVKNERQFFPENPSNADGRGWLTNVYRHEDKSLLGFVHVEQSGNGKKFRIGLAHSTNNGGTWTYLGHVVKQQNDGDMANTTGTPYLIRDGHLYVYYADSVGPSVIRAPLAEVVAAAKQGKLSPWLKYFDGGFTEPAWGGRSSRLAVRNSLLHSDAAYSTTKRKYVLTGYNHDPGRGVWIAFSDDAVNWRAAGWLQHGREDNRTLSPYVTIVDEDGSDNAEVGGSFYAYWGFTPDWDGQGNLGLQYVVRQKVTLVAP